MWRDYLMLTKPRLTLLALATVFSSFYVGTAGHLNWPLLVHTLLGAGLIGGGANALNQYLERDIDSKMRRTEKRPLPSKKLEPAQALIFGVSLSSAGFFYLWRFANPLAGLIGFLTLGSYIFLYTPLKRRTVMNTYVGAIPGALPCLLGWAAARGHLNRDAWALFLILFAWQLPHFLAIAWIYREDYKQGGLRMFGGLDADGRKTRVQMVFYSLALFLVSVIPTLIGMMGLLYLTAAIFSGLLFVSFACYIAAHRFVYAKEFVTASIFYLSVINIFMFLDKI